MGAGTGPSPWNGGGLSDGGGPDEWVSGNAIGASGTKPDGSTGGPRLPSARNVGLIGIAVDAVDAADCFERFADRRDSERYSCGISGSCGTV